MRIISMLAILLFSVVAVAVNVKVSGVRVEASPGNSGAGKYFDQRFTFETEDFGKLEANVCSRLARQENYLPGDVNQLETLQLASERQKEVELEIFFSGSKPSRDTCISNAKLLAN